MSDKSFSNELERVIARPDAKTLLDDVHAYHRNYKSLVGEEPSSEEGNRGADAIYDASRNDPERAFAYTVLAMANYDDEAFLHFVAAGPLEDVLRKPSDELVERVIVEARRTPRFRWMLNGVYPHAIRKDVAERIAFECGGWVEEYAVPPRPFA